MVKIRKPIIEHQSMLPIIQELAKEHDNSLGLSKKINKDQSTLNIHLKYLYEEKFIEESKEKSRAYEINYPHLIQEFYIYVYENYVNKIPFPSLLSKSELKEIEPIRKGLYLESLDKYKLNIAIQELFRRLCIYFHNNYEKYENPTIKTTFEELIRLILLLKTEEINFFLDSLKNIQDKSLFNDFIENIKHNTLSLETTNIKIELGFIENPLNYNTGELNKRYSKE